MAMVRSTVVLSCGGDGCGHVKFSADGKVLKTEVRIKTGAMPTGQYYLFVLDGAFTARHYRLGADSEICKVIEERRETVLDARTVCAVCDVSAGYYSLTAIGGNRGKKEYAEVAEKYFKNSEIYLPRVPSAERNKHDDILSKIEYVAKPQPVREEREIPEPDPIERLIKPETAETVARIERVIDGGHEKYYDRIRGQLLKIFATYESEENLEHIIDDSRWAKVRYGGAGDYYIVGVIYDGESPAYIGYGVPGASGEKPPEELENFCEWLPARQDGFGYWMMYQSADSGKAIRVIR